MNETRTDDAIYSRTCPGPLEHVLERLEAALGEEGFGVLGTYDLRAKLTDKGFSLDSECRVLDVCSPGHAKTALDTDMSVATLLPCRVAVYGSDEAATIAMIRPKTALGVLGTGALEGLAATVEEALARAIDAAASEGD